MARPTGRLLLIEPDRGVAAAIREQLDQRQLGGALQHVCEAGTVSAPPQAAVISAVLPDLFGLVGSLLRLSPDPAVWVLCREHEIDRATEAVSRGAAGYVVRRGDFAQTLAQLVEREFARREREARRLDKLTAMDLALREAQARADRLGRQVHELTTAASTDPLTGLVNRRGFSESVERVFAEADRYQRDLACLMIDLDGFKLVNDTFGHAAGDRVLQAAAKVLKSNCRRSDIAGRLGGDEFVLMMPQTDEGFASAVAQRVREQFSLSAAPLLPQRLGVAAGMSMGLATLARTRAPHADRLMSHADAALYHAKRRGRGRLMIYRPRAAAAGTGPNIDLSSRG